MSEQLIIALIGFGGGLLGGIVAGLYTYNATMKAAKQTADATIDAAKRAIKADIRRRLAPNISAFLASSVIDYAETLRQSAQPDLTRLSNLRDMAYSDARSLYYEGEPELSSALDTALIDYLDELTLFVHGNKTRREIDKYQEQMNERIYNILQR